MFDWDDLRIFDVLARTGSLAATARELHVNHATVSRRVAALEAALGLSLVRRLARSTPLTAQGAAVARLAADMERTAQAVDREARSLSTGVSGEVSVSLPPALASHFLAERLPELQALHPALAVTLKATSAVSSLERGEADIALRLVRPDGPAQFVRRLGVMRLGLFAASNMATRPPAAWRFILAGEDQADLPHQAWLGRYRGERPVAMRSSDVHSQIAAARAGLGVAALPFFMVSDDDLVQVDPGATVPSRAIWLVVHAGVRKAPAVQATSAWIAETFAASIFRPPADFDRA